MRARKMLIIMHYDYQNTRQNDKIQYVSNTPVTPAGDLTASKKVQHRRKHEDNSRKAPKITNFKIAAL